MFGRMGVLLCAGGLLALMAATGHAELIAYWPMDEGSGVTVTDEVGGFNGTIAGTVQWVAGMFGSGILFPGTQGNNVNCGSIDLNIGSNFTLACWIKMPDCADRFHDIFAKGPKAAGHFELYINGSGAGGGDRLRGDASAYIPDLGDFWSNIKVDDDTWHHIAWTYNGSAVVCYVDGGSTGQKTWARSGSVVSTTGEFRIGSLADQSNPFGGTVDEVAIFDSALTVEEVQAIMGGVGKNETATAPSPADLAVDVVRTVALSWSPGEYAATHDVYFGTSFDAVLAASRANPGAVLLSRGQTGASYTLPSRLEFGQTYYWRIDEVNAAPDYTIFPGDVWSFTVEPFTYVVGNVTATTNGVSEEGMGPERTVDGSGLSPEGLHSMLDADMWLAAPAGEEPVWIQYAFDRVYKLYEMHVWNYGVSMEKTVGFGLKDVTVEYSTDAVEWTALGEVQFAQAATGKPAPSMPPIAFDGAAAQYVRFTVNSGWKTLGQYGLSEVRFYQIPTFAREPSPADGATDVSVGAVLSWRAGREAVSHRVHFDTEEAVVAGGVAPVDVVAGTEYDPGVLDVATTYYWKVDEVNEAEADSVWEGNTWSFSTQESLLVDDFESYEDEEPLRIFDTWLDGWGKESTNGALVGYDKAPFAERVIVLSGRQSMNLAYDQGTARISEAERSWAAPQDWTLHGVEMLRVWFRGRPAPAAVGFDAAAGSYTVSSTGDGSRRDIFGTADAFHFVYASLTGNGSITARVDNISGGGLWAKVGVMVRESLDAGAAHAMMSVTPANRVSFVRRLTAGGASTDVNGDAGAFALPRWVRVTRTGNILRAEQSSDGVTWVGPTADAAQAEVGIMLPETVYVGLAFSSYTGGFAEATFSNVKTVGSVSPGGAFTTWRDIGIANNAPDRLYVSLQDKAGHSGTVSHEDGPGAVNTTYWKAWDIPLNEFAVAGVDLTGVKKMFIGLGDRNAAPSGAAGVIYVDDIQLCRSTVAGGEPILHLDASALALQDGDPVVEWGGVSAVGTPVFEQLQTPGGGPAVVFDGVAHLGQVTLPSSSAGDFILAAVISPKDLNAYHNIVDDDAAQRPMLWVDNRSPSTYEANYSPTGAIAAEAGGSGVEQWDIVIMDSRSGVFFLNSPTVPHFINAVSWLPAAGSQGFSLFNRGGAAAFQGRVAELRIYNDAAAFGLDYAGLYQELFDKWFGEGSR